MSKEDFLFELQCEELPAKSQKKLMNALTASFLKQCEAHQLTVHSVKGFVSARHLGLIAFGLDQTARAETIVKKGPSVRLAYDVSGNPTPQCIGFAKSVGVPVEQLQTMTVKGEECVSYTMVQEGRSAPVILPEIMEACLKQLPIPKRMRWSDSKAEFLRPVHGVIALLGEHVVPLTCFEHEAGKDTMGHRFLSEKRFVIAHPRDYVDTMREHFVMVDAEEREAFIRKEIESISTGTPRIPEALLEEVSGLVEWPRALLGKFDELFLELPKEILMASMQDHQRYFAVMSGQQLLNQFVFITHLTCKDPSRIIEGNQRVLRARLSDARFFYEKDRGKTLDARVPELNKVIFQQELGTLLDKTKRVEQLMKRFVGTEDAMLSARLMKTDLLTQMVGEFPELQGVMGKYYALQDGHSPETAVAIEEHYAPRGESVSFLGRMLGLLDRVDTLIGLFGIGLIPTGDKDPYALRRAALDVTFVLNSNGFENIDLIELLDASRAQFTQTFPPNVVETVHAFIVERLKHAWVSLGIAQDVFQSVIAVQCRNVSDASKRMQAVSEFRNTEDGAALSLANKRVKNILEKANFKPFSSVNASLFEADQEKKLFESMHTIREMISKKELHRDKLTALAALRAPVDAFFDHVMVMADDVSLRDNRLHLLNELRTLFLTVADIALLQ